MKSENELMQELLEHVDEYGYDTPSMELIIKLDREEVRKDIIEKERIINKNLILDACCGGRMFWWNKDHPNVTYADKRSVAKGAFNNGWNPNWCIRPDIQCDFRNLPFPDKSFRMVVYDPPHLTSGSEKGVINIKYGLLDNNTWEQDIVAGFVECWRVLDDYGTLIFKWCEANIKVKDLLRKFPVSPLFGDFTGKTGKTVWVVYMKIPKEN